MAVVRRLRCPSNRPTVTSPTPFMTPCEAHMWRGDLEAEAAQVGVEDGEGALALHLFPEGAPQRALVDGGMDGHGRSPDVFPWAPPVPREQRRRFRGENAVRAEGRGGGRRPPIGLLQNGKPPWGTRSEPANDDAPEHGFAFRATLRL